MSIWKRLKNLWELSHFEITRFDNQLVITRKEEGLVFARPIEWEKQDMSHPDNWDKGFYFPKKVDRPMATIIKLKPKDEVEQILKDADQS